MNISTDPRILELEKKISSFQEEIPGKEEIIVKKEAELLENATSRKNLLVKLKLGDIPKSKYEKLAAPLDNNKKELLAEIEDLRFNLDAHKSSIEELGQRLIQMAETVKQEILEVINSELKGLQKEFANIFTDEMELKVYRLISLSLERDKLTKSYFYQTAKRPYTEVLPPSYEIVKILLCQDYDIRNKHLDTYSSGFLNSNFYDYKIDQDSQNNEMEGSNDNFPEQEINSNNTELQSNRVSTEIIKNSARF